MNIGCVVVDYPYRFQQLEFGEIVTRKNAESDLPLHLWPGKLLAFQVEPDINGYTESVGIVMSEQGLLEAVNLCRIRITGETKGR